MRKWVVLIYLFCSTFFIFLTSCARYNSAQGNNVNKPIGETIKNPSEFVATEKVGNLPRKYTNSIIENELLVSGVKIADGYLVAANSEKSSVTKYDLQGELIWDKEHAIASNDYYATNYIVPTPEGGFILSTIVSTYQNSDGTWKKTDPLVEKYDKDGNLIWSKSYKGFSDTTLEKIFCLSNGDIFTIGYTETKETKTIGVLAAGDIYISKLDRNGNLISEGYYGGSDFDFLYDAEYIEGVGIVALISTQSDDGTFSASSNEYPVGVIAVFDLTLKLSWQKNFEVYLGANSMAVHDKNIYVLESVNVKKGESYCNYKLHRIASDGNLVFTKDLGNSNSIKLIKGCSKGVLLKNENKLLLLDMDGKEKLKFSFDAGDVDKIIEYDDYFLILSTNITGNLPQPSYISMRWHSTELVYSGYDYDGRLLWREAFDSTPENMKNYDPKKDK